MKSNIGENTANKKITIEKETPLEKALKSGNDEVIAKAIQDLLIKDASGEQNGKRK